MEDKVTVIEKFNNVNDQLYVGLFDGHAGKSLSDYCGANLHERILSNLEKEKEISDNLNASFLSIDNEQSLSSGCTAVVSLILHQGANKEINQKNREAEGSRTLYTANVGDARAVLCRAGQAIRLTYDHKGSDDNEQKRIMDAGGYILNGRVNGVLAVTRALGDSPMKQYVVGSPYTTEIDITDDDEWLVIACDGLWDVATDSEVCELIKECKSGEEASKLLLEYALNNLSTDNLSIVVIKF